MRIIALALSAVGNCTVSEITEVLSDPKSSTQTVGLGAGGYTTTSVANTEEWSGPQTTATASTITTS